MKLKLYDNFITVMTKFPEFVATNRKYLNARSGQINVETLSSWQNHKTAGKRVKRLLRLASLEQGKFDFFTMITNKCLFACFPVGSRDE